MAKKCLILALVLMVATPLSAGAARYEPANLAPPQPQREFRGAWVATVKNIDWPSKPGLTTAEQKAELLDILDRAAQLKLNAIIFQVRPMCDAMYASPHEPWSPYLTGAMGKAPSPAYDPLAFAVAEAHHRGLELHAWFNPYRALVKAPDIRLSAGHVSQARPDLVRDYGKFLWLDPGERAVQDHSLKVVADVVKRYDVDGVHFDDYFYPYREKGPDGKDLDFPDAASWQKFGVASGLSRADWRRENVNTFVQRVYKTIKSAKPWVKFGISPFGIWRPGHPNQIQGLDAYEALYADARKWLMHGWVDYFAPQIYWRIDPPQQSFPVLLEWWVAQNKPNRHLWPGMNTASATTTPWARDEIPRQIGIARKQSGVTGHLHWNMKNLSRNRELNETLARGLYTEPALIPASPWLGSTPPARPSLHAAEKSGGAVKISWKPGDAGKPRLWVLQTRRAGRWTTLILPGDERSHVAAGSAPDAIAVSAVDRVGNLSSPATVIRKGE